MISQPENGYMSTELNRRELACRSLSMILPVLQEDMKVTTVQHAPRTCHDTESNFGEVWESPTLRPIGNGEEWGGSDAAISLGGSSGGAS
jgi:hypothetical protein